MPYNQYMQGALSLNSVPSSRLAVKQDAANEFAMNDAARGVERLADMKRYALDAEAMRGNRRMRDRDMRYALGAGKRNLVSHISALGVTAADAIHARLVENRRAERERTFWDDYYKRIENIYDTGKSRYNEALLSNFTPARVLYDEWDELGKVKKPIKRYPSVTPATSPALGLYSR